MRDSIQTLCALRKQMGEDRSPDSARGKGTFPSGYGPLDAYLDGGFQRGQLHEIFADNAEDNGSAAGFAAMLALCGSEPGKSILWLRTLAAMRRGGRFNPAGFVELGGDPSTLLMAVAQDETALLRSAVDALRCDGFSLVVIECWGTPAILDLTASRRLTLAADRSGVTALMLRPEASEQPSTANTRWLVRSSPSTPLEANAPGHPMLDLTLLKRRAGPSGQSWQVEWDRDNRSFRKPATCRYAASPSGPTPLSGPVVPFSGSEPAPARKRARISA